MSLPPRKEIAARQDSLRKSLRKEKISAAYFSSRSSVRYYTGFTGDDSTALLTPGTCTLFTDSRYTEEAEHTAPGCEVVQWQQGREHDAGAHARGLGLKSLAVEERNIALAGFKSFRKAARGVKITNGQAIISSPRKSKSTWEIKMISKALRIAERAFIQVKGNLKPGMTEQDVALELDYRMRSLGADGSAFPTIVAVGANASLPHAHPGRRKLKRGKMLLIDWGACLDGYNSDLTRTLFLDSIPRSWQARYNAVLKAQMLALDSIGPGLTGSEADGLARESLVEDKLSEYFSHSLGHGVGLEVHEGPNLSQRNNSLLGSGVVVTVEPGIYLPRRGGIRIEDMVLLTDKGRQVMSQLPKDLDWTVC